MTSSGGNRIGNETGQIFIRRTELGSNILFEMPEQTLNQCVTDGRMVEPLRLFHP